MESYSIFSFSIMSSRCIHVLACMYTPHVAYPFLCCRTLGLVPCCTAPGFETPGVAGGPKPLVGVYDGSQGKLCPCPWLRIQSSGSHSWLYVSIFWRDFKTDPCSGISTLDSNLTSLWWEQYFFKALVSVIFKALRLFKVLILFHCAAKSKNHWLGFLSLSFELLFLVI